MAGNGFNFVSRVALSIEFSCLVFSAKRLTRRERTRLEDKVRLMGVHTSKLRHHSHHHKKDAEDSVGSELESSGDAKRE